MDIEEEYEQNSEEKSSDNNPKKVIKKTFKTYKKYTIEQKLYFIYLQSEKNFIIYLIHSGLIENHLESGGIKRMN